MKKKHNEGFSLVETLISITVLALIVIPTCSGIVMGFRMNAKSDELMKAQLAVSSAVETLMAEGIPNDTLPTPDGEDYGKSGEEDRFPDVTIQLTPQGSYKLGEETYYTYYSATVRSNVDEDVSVTTSIRAVAPEEGGTG